MRQIDADALKEKAITLEEGCREWEVVTISEIDNAPTIERKTGQWIEVKDKFAYAIYYHWDCSECKAQYGKPYNFCPNCGADMRGGGE
jgi:rRNA maturation endonuclease Nob1